MANVKIKTAKTHRFSNSVILGSTKVPFSSEGIAEVSEDILKSILEADPELKLVPEKSEDPKDEYKKQLLIMSKVDLVKLAVDSQLPEEEYKDLNKEKLVAYLVSKL